jgi:hypothetical protein
MLIAQQKKEENIAEYILYIFQIEDVIRAYNFDLERIIFEFVKPQLPDESFLSEYRKWYMGLISQMKQRGLDKHGHIDEVKEILVELSYLHNTLLNLANDDKYRSTFERANTYLEEFKQKSNLKEKNNIEILFHAMYMKLLLRLQKKEISSETEEAFDTMRMVLAYLARSYKRMKSGDMDFLNN